MSIALLVAACGSDETTDGSGSARGGLVSTTTSGPAAPHRAPTAAPRDRHPVLPPHAGARATNSHIFGGGKILIAYYGTAGTGSLGVLGETSPEVMQQRLARAARPFAGPHRPVQLVYELIATVADGTPGPGHSYSHDIPRADVERYIAAAHRHHALVVLDLQTGRTDFTTVAKRWAWALRDPSVGLALDPEWRMHAGEVPGRTIGWVDAAEVNRTSAWLRSLQVRAHLPEKLFLLHQFRTSMIHHVDAVRARRGLAEVQHVDGYGTPGQKLDTYRAVERPRKFFMGFKLFYDEDVHRLSAADVLKIHPSVRFVSFQ